MKENSIEEDIRNAEHFINSIKTDKEYEEENGWHGYYNKEIVELVRMLEHILSDYKRVLKENEELKERIREHTLLISPYYVKENFIPVQKVKDKIEYYQKLQDNYIEKYDEINEGLQAMINVLQEIARK